MPNKLSFVCLLMMLAAEGNPRPTPADAMREFDQPSEFLRSIASQMVLNVGRVVGACCEHRNASDAGNRTCLSARRLHSALQLSSRAADEFHIVWMEWVDRFHMRRALSQSFFAELAKLPENRQQTPAVDKEREDDAEEARLYGRTTA